ncbi:MAG: hypothetical protein KAU52_00730 [Methanosarcinales archaeon]|nr:hypothetical protein [Methanosarcinales archaeon]
MNLRRDFFTGDDETRAFTNTGCVIASLYHFHALAIEKMCGPRASPAGESGDRFRSGLAESSAMRRSLLLALVVSKYS